MLIRRLGLAFQHEPTFQQTTYGAIVRTPCRTLIHSINYTVGGFKYVHCHPSEKNTSVVKHPEIMKKQIQLETQAEIMALMDSKSTAPNLMT